MQPSGSLSLARIASLALPAGSLHGILACTCKFTMSASSPAGIPRTRRELSQLTVIQLRSLASQHGLTSTGRKSALVDRLYRLRNDSSSGRERSPNPHSSRSPAHTPARPRSYGTLNVPKIFLIHHDILRVILRPNDYRVILRPNRCGIPGVILRQMADTCCV